MLILVSCDVTVHTGPTIVGDAFSNIELMESLDAKLIQTKCQTYFQYVTQKPPRIVLDQLIQKGFHLIGMSGVGQTLVWTLEQR